MPNGSDSGERQPDGEQQAVEEGADGGLLEGACQHLAIETLSQCPGRIGQWLHGRQEDPGPEAGRLGQDEEYGRQHGRSQQHPVIGDGAIATEAHRQGDLAAGGIGFDVAHVVDVEHGGSQQATGGRGQQQIPLQGLGKEVVGAEHPQQAEEEEHRDIAKAAITVRSLAHRVGHRSDDGRPAQHHERQDLQPRLPEGAAQQQQAARHRRQRGQCHRHAHLLAGDEAGYHGPLGTDPLAIVGTGDRIAVVVGQIGEDLQQDGGQQGERHDGAVEGAAAGGQPGTQENGRAGERQCSQTSRQQPCW